MRLPALQASSIKRMAAILSAVPINRPRRPPRLSWLFFSK
jgi:hypothetical protein